MCTINFTCLLFFHLLTPFSFLTEIFKTADEIRTPCSVHSRVKNCRALIGLSRAFLSEALERPIRGDPIYCTTRNPRAVYIYVYVYVYICIYVYMYMCICVYVYMCICVYVYMCICVYVYVYVYVYVHINIC